MVSDLPPAMLSAESLFTYVIASRNVQRSPDPLVQRTLSGGSVVVPVLSAVVLTKNVFPALGTVIAGDTPSALNTTRPSLASGLTRAETAATTLLDERPVEATRGEDKVGAAKLPDETSE